MIKYIIIAVLVFDAGFVFGSGWGYRRREDERKEIVQNDGHR